MKRILALIFALVCAAAAQQVQVKDSTGSVTYRTGTNLVSDVQPFQVLSIVEEFVGFSTGDGTTGSNGWRAFDIAGAGSIAGQVASGSAWGVVRNTTGAGSNDARWLGLGGTASAAMFDDLHTLVPWSSWFRFQISRTTNASVLVGFVDDPFSAPTTSDQIALRFDTASDSTLKVLCRASGTSTVTDTTVTPSAATWYSLKIWSDTAGTIKFRVYSAAGVALGNEVSIATNVPGTVMCPGFYVKSLTTSALSLDADAFRMLATLTR